MFYKKDPSGYKRPMEGAELKALVYGEKTMLCEFRLKGGATVPVHEHPHEQTGYLISGEMVLTIGDEDFHVTPGDSWSIPGGIPHKAKVLEDSLVVEVFSPLREDYL